MIRYSISYKNPLTHLIDIEISISNIKDSFIELQLPAWRPGRYELQNYAANIKQVKALGANGQPLSYSKISRNRWKIENQQNQEIKFQYKYYAYQMDAGGCWLDEEQLYLNFICCLMYLPERINEACTVQLSLPDDYIVACGLPKKEHLLSAKNFYQLADSPMIASASLSHLEFDCRNTPFHIWIQGENLLDPDKIINDFKKFTALQIDTMGDFPEKEYHYLFQFLPYRHYHGVEHRNSTVITLGPAEFVAENGYEDLIGISSHELFHAWNIIKIRPAEMMPYDFTKENYFTTGYVAEGFTTYYGDLFLVRSGVISKEEYFSELNTTFKKHFGHFGNYNLSLAESSQDLWVDGYVAGIPDRKVSIYAKGSIVALLLDLEIREKTKHDKSLDDLMRLLWNEFGKKEKGYLHQDIVSATEKITGSEMKDFFEECISGHTDMKIRLVKALKTVGCLLQEKYSESTLERAYGFRCSVRNNKLLIEAIAQQSPAEKALSKDDEILTINGHSISGDINNFISLENELLLTVKRWGQMLSVSLVKDRTENYFTDYTITPNPNANILEKGNMERWLLQ